MYVAKFEAGFPEGNNDTTSKKSSQIYTQSVAYVGATEAGMTDISVQTARNWLDGIYGETEMKISYPVFQPLTYSMNYININDIYNICRAMNEEGNIYGFTISTSDTHLMKNSEWGMVSYLSYSKYGTNGQKIATNNANLNSGGSNRTVSTGKNGVDSVYGITGMTDGTTNGEETVVKIEEIRTLRGNTPTATGRMYAWNQKEGVVASSTRNVTGVYDLSGGLWERTASYVANNHNNLLINGKSMTYEKDILKTISTKYSMVYAHDSSIDDITKPITDENLNAASKANYQKNNIFGDAIKETSILGTSTNSWEDDYSIFSGLNSIFFSRGGSFGGKGRFSFNGDSGDSYFVIDFRAIVIPI